MILRSLCSAWKIKVIGPSTVRSILQLAGLGGMTLAGVTWMQYKSQVSCCTTDTSKEVKIEAGVVHSSLPDYKLEEIARHKGAETGVWVTYKDGVYDITEFMDAHPGGREKIIRAAGTSVEPFWEVYTSHNTEEVKEMLEALRIGNVHPSDRGKSIGRKQEGPYANEPERSPINKVIAQAPYLSETPSVLFTDSYTTPNDIFFVRNHLPVPLVDPQKYVLKVRCQGQEPVELTLEDLRTKFKQYAITAIIHCAGNRRSELAAFKPLRSVNCTGGYMGNATVSLQNNCLTA